MGRALHECPLAAIVRPDGASMAYRERPGTRDGPDDPILLMIHGGGMSGATWTLAADQIPGPRILAPDLRGHGGSSHARGAYELPSFVEDVLALLDARAPDRPFVVVGHSLGGSVAARVALARPDRVRGVVLVDAAFHPDGPPLGRIASFMRNLPEVFDTPEDAIAWARNGWPVRNRESVRRVIPTLLQTRANGSGAGTAGPWVWSVDLALLDVDLWKRWTLDLGEALATPLRAPVRVVRAEGNFVPRSSIRELESMGVRVTTVPRAGHVVHEDAPEAFAAILGEVLDDAIGGASWNR